MSLVVLDIECIETKIVKELGFYKNGQTVGYSFLLFHSARLAQRHLPAKHELRRKGLNNEKVLERRVEMFQISINQQVFLRNTKNGHKIEKNRTTANIVKNGRT